jgi:hypothetical protein
LIGAAVVSGTKNPRDEVFASPNRHCNRKKMTASSPIMRLEVVIFGVWEGPDLQVRSVALHYNHRNDCPHFACGIPSFSFTSFVILNACQES